MQEALKLQKVAKTSGASFNIVKLSTILPLQNKFSKLLVRRKWHSGRSITGRITVYSKGPRIKRTTPRINYSFRSSSLFFIGGIHYSGFHKKIVSLIFNSTGVITYLPSKFNDAFFQLKKLKKLTFNETRLYKELLHFKPQARIVPTPYMLLQQKKNANISFLELKPLRGMEYARSLGSSASIIKLDTRTGFSLVKLPSGIKKVFSAFSLSCEGSANISILRKQLKSTKAGDLKVTGRKPNVRGVAMNPVDHPHGGRTKSLKYPRTPWGKTTKFK